MRRFPNCQTLMPCCGVSGTNESPDRNERRSGLTDSADSSSHFRPEPTRRSHHAESSTHPALAFTATGGGADVDEFTPATPVTEGGRACLEAESLLRQLAEHGQLQAIILRLAGIYGPDRLLRRVTELKSGVPITTPPDDWLNLIHVDDAVAMIQHTLQSSEIESHLTKGSIVINVVASETVTRREYYEQLAKLVNAPAPVFQSSTSLPAQPESPRSRGRSGNRRVVSTTRPRLAVDFLFDNLISGLADAVTRSSANHD